jgi:ATP-dependent DNA ligase
MGWSIDCAPLIIAAIPALPARSCVVDGEAIACEKKGLSVFENDPLAAAR